MLVAGVITSAVMPTARIVAGVPTSIQVIGTGLAASDAYYGVLSTDSCSNAPASGITITTTSATATAADLLATSTISGRSVCLFAFLVSHPPDLSPYSLQLLQPQTVHQIFQHSAARRHLAESVAHLDCGVVHSNLLATSGGFQDRVSHFGLWCWLADH